VIEKFPYGKAPFWLLMVSLLSTVLLVATRPPAASKPDIIFTTFTPVHAEAYRRLAPEFERAHGVRVSIQLVHQQGLTSRLQNALLAGTAVPDMVELLAGTMGYFVSGPLRDVGFTDLTDRVAHEGLRQKLVESRFSLWSSRGHVFALPHDVHPVGLMYRADLVEALGIDVSKLVTWQDFVAMGQKVTRDLDGDGVIDRYAIDLPLGGSDGLMLLLAQRDVGLFDETGRITFNDPRTVATIIWYLHQTRGKNRIATECGWGQPFMKAVTDGLALFYLAPDWRTYQTETDLPRLAGKMKVMPLPAWEPGGRRTSTWGGTGLVITKASQHQELDWEFAKFLYLNKSELGHRFAATNIIPPFKDAWNLPEFHQPNAYFSGQALGDIYAALAPSTPNVYSTAFYQLATDKLGEAFLRGAEYFEKNGDAGLEQVVQHELAEAESYVRHVSERRMLVMRDE
jgi:arabinosaccharide transport system substrate-binding protein